MIRYWAVMLAFLAGCDTLGPLPAPAAGDTGLRGIVVRGPVEPVCQEGVPCDAPFAGTFIVRRDGRDVGTFATGADGRFAVRLAPGDYTVHPGPDAPILQPADQSQPATVGPSGVTEVTLSFDTGIR